MKVNISPDSFSGVVVGPVELWGAHAPSRAGEGALAFANFSLVPLSAFAKLIELTRRRL
jgi:hypothetical protein